MKRRDFIKKGFVSSFVVAAAPMVFSSCKKDDDDNDLDPISDDDDDANGDDNGNGNGNGNGDDNGNGQVSGIDLNSSEYSDLKTTGNYKYYQNYIVINIGSGFIALAKACTHQGCDVQYNHSNQNIQCPCHGSVFETNGSVEQGPAETPLQVYNVTQQGDILTIN